MDFSTTELQAIECLSGKPEVERTIGGLELALVGGGLGDIELG